MGLPVFVVSHSIPREWVYEGSPFTFVTSGVESAIERTRTVAGDKDVGVGGANIAQKAIKAGLVDEVGVDLVPVLFGGGVRFFDHLGDRSPRGSSPPVPRREGGLTVRSCS